MLNLIKTSMLWHYSSAFTNACY